MESQSKMQMKSGKKGKKSRWDPAVTAAKLVWENQEVKHGRKDETERGWEIRFYQNVLSL